MPQERKDLFYVGEMHPVTGEPLEWFNFAPARDLSKEETAGLSDDQYKALADSPLYQVTKPTAAIDKTSKADKED